MVKENKFLKLNDDEIKQKASNLVKDVTVMNSDITILRLKNFLNGLQKNDSELNFVNDKKIEEFINMYQLFRQVDIDFKFNSHVEIFSKILSASQDPQNEDDIISILETKIREFTYRKAQDEMEKVIRNIESHIKQKDLKHPHRLFAFLAEREKGKSSFESKVLIPFLQSLIPLIGSFEDPITTLDWSSWRKEYESTLERLLTLEDKENIHLRAYLSTSSIKGVRFSMDDPKILFGIFNKEREFSKDKTSGPAREVSQGETPDFKDDKEIIESFELHFEGNPLDDSEDLKKTERKNKSK